MARRRGQLARVQDRAQALGPQAVGRTAPSVPAAREQIRERRRIAVDLAHADAAREVVGPVALGHVAARARQRSACGEALIEEEARPEVYGVGLPRDPVARIGLRGRRPRPVGEDDLDLAFAEDGLCGEILLRGARPREQCAGCGASGANCEPFLQLEAGNHGIMPPLQVTTQHHILCAGSTGGGDDRLTRWRNREGPGGCLTPLNAYRSCSAFSSERGSPLRCRSRA